MEHGERYLSALLSADVVGYSRLMGADEDATIAALSAARNAVEQSLLAHRGRLVDFTGDNFLAEFPTATEALACAVELQRVFAQRNVSVPGERRMEFRIGVHLGEVCKKESQIYGDGVNIASRLEGLARPGGICISSVVYGQVHGKLALSFEDLGTRSLKNIAEPLHVYLVKNDGDGTMIRHRPVRKRIVLAGGAALLAVGLLGVGWWLTGRKPAAPAEQGARGSVLEAGGAQALDELPAIAVLPFDNLSGDPDQEYFADGIAEDLITRLSLWRSFPVIARNSSFTYKGRAVDVKQVGAELGARYVIEGSVRNAAGRVRISAQVIDAQTGHHIWASTYDHDLRDIFALQDEITLAIASAMFPELLQSESVRVLRKAPGDLSAWDLVQRARWHMRALMGTGGAAELVKSKRFIEAAIERDPLFPDAHALLSMCLYAEIVYQLTEEPARLTEEMLRTARRSVDLDPRRGIGHAALALALSLTGDRQEMRDTAARLIELDPSSALGYMLFAVALSGDRRTADRSIELNAKFMRLSPHDPMLWVGYDTLASAHRTMGRYTEAVAAELRVVQLRSHYSWGHLFLASSYAHLGELDKAAASLQEALRLQPGLSIDLVRKAYSYSEPEVVERIIDGLRKAGWKG